MKCVICPRQSAANHDVNRGHEKAKHIDLPPQRTRPSPVGGVQHSWLDRVHCLRTVAAQSQQDRPPLLSIVVLIDHIHLAI
uniref:Transposase n=1 Tax=Angiostrongylus cantonensis TaxID=6313 RepID=A0A0K0DBV3_ANGCA